MSSIKNMNHNDMFSAVLAGEAEFKRALKEANESLPNFTTPATLAIPDTFDEEVSYRPAVQ